MQAAVLTEYGQFEWKEVPVPRCGSRQVLVRVGYASICGTDLHIFRGKFRERTTLPLIPGHEFAGEVVETGEEVASFQTGDRVTVDPIIWCGECAACEEGHYPACRDLELLGIDRDGGFRQYIAVDEGKAYALPESISDRHAALIEVFSIGFHAKNRGQVTPGEQVAIWGAGRAGQCILQAVRLVTSNTIVVVDVLDERLALAKSIDEEIITVNARKQDPVEVIRSVTDGDGVDLAYEAVGHAVETPHAPNPVQAAIRSIRSGGRICILGLGDESSSIYTRELVLKEATMRTSRVSLGEFREAIHHMGEGDLVVEPLISGEYYGSEVQEAITSLERNPGSTLKLLLNIRKG